MMNKMGRPRKPATEARTVQLGIRCEIWLKHKLDELAKKEERTVTQIARQALKEYVERKSSRVAA